MGTAGLDLKGLIGLLERLKVDCNLVEGDEAEDHCLLRLTSTSLPNHQALIEYVNIGCEPRVATIRVEHSPPPQVSRLELVGQFFWISEEGINLRGAQKDDPKKIVELVKRIFLEPTN